MLSPLKNDVLVSADQLDLSFLVDGNNQILLVYSDYFRGLAGLDFSELFTGLDWVRCQQVVAAAVADQKLGEFWSVIRLFGVDYGCLVDVDPVWSASGQAQMLRVGVLFH